MSMGTSEKVLAGFLQGLPRGSYLVSDKFTPQCVDSSSPTAMADMIEMQLKLMELDHFSGILDYCRENGITFYAYMVPEQDALSGKYDTKQPMPAGSARAETCNPVLDKLEILNAVLKKLADKYNVGAAQIPVAWAIDKGTLPIIGVTKENQVLDAVKAANVTLTAEETAELEKVADSLDLNVIRFWEKEMK